MHAARWAKRAKHFDGEAARCADDAEKSKEKVLPIRNSLKSLKDQVDSRSGRKGQRADLKSSEEIESLHRKIAYYNKAESDSRKLVPYYSDLAANSRQEIVKLNFVKGQPF